MRARSMVKDLYKKFQDYPSRKCEGCLFMNLEKIREDFPITKNYVYLNCARVAPIPKPVVDVLKKFHENRMLHNPDFLYYPLEEEVEKTRSLFGKLINAEKEEIAFLQNTTQGTNIVANIMDLKRGDNVIISDLEYPSNTYPWLKLRKRGVEVKFLRSKNGIVSVQDIEEAIDERTRIIASTFVCYFNGFRQDLESLGKIARENDVYLFVDPMQGLGALEFDVKKFNIDFLATNSYKWLLGPLCVGEFYVRKELLEEFEPLDIGWRSVRNVVDRNVEKIDITDAARKFETGGIDYASILALKVSLEYILGLGISNIERRIMKLTDIVVEGLRKINANILSPLSRESRSGIILFNVDGVEPKVVVDKLASKNIIVGAQRRETNRGIEIGVKVSPHFFNLESEIELLVNEVSKITYESARK